MSKPDPAGGSLESILASIRQSLAEQSGEAPGEAPNHPSPDPSEAHPTRRSGLAQRLAGAIPDPGSPGSNRPPDDLSDLLESSPGPAAPASHAPAPDPAPAEDPLWFLTRRDERPAPQGVAPAPVRAERDAPAPVRAPAPAPEPKLTRPEVLRASMPPFFGSSTDTSNIPMPVETPPHGVAAEQPAPESAPPVAATDAPGTAAAPSTRSIAQEVSLLAAAAETAASRSGHSERPAFNGQAHPTPTQASPKTADVAASQNSALEAVVLELLKPMLRQWLDENMPRLVAQALGEHGEHPRTPQRDGRNI